MYEKMGYEQYAILNGLIWLGFEWVYTNISIQDDYKYYYAVKINLLK